MPVHVSSTYARSKWLGRAKRITPVSKPAVAVHAGGQQRVGRDVARAACKYRARACGNSMPAAFWAAW